MPKKERLDSALVRRGLAETRAKAQALVMAGVVTADGARVEKCGAQVLLDAEISVKEKPHPYVGRGGMKLAAALDAFNVDAEGKRCLDIGASTGGFTHCLLLRGAAHVTALDVGRGQLDASLRADARVRAMEGVNARRLDEHELGGAFDIVVMDVFFISARKILPQFRRVMKEDAHAVVLIKPQFEVGKSEVGKGGVVRDPALHARVVRETEEFLRAEGFRVRGVIESPVKGADGNKEFLIHFTPS